MMANSAPSSDSPTLDRDEPSPEQPLLLSFSGMSKSFGLVHALQAVDLTIRKGERIAILGHNGAGKSTLMSVVTGAFQGTAGRMVYEGVDHGLGWSISTARRSGVRFAHQEFALADNLTVCENLRLQDHSLRGAAWRARARKLIRASLDEIFPGNGISADAVVADLSVSTRQMVEVARAFTRGEGDVKLVILDEPTSSLDNESADALLRYMRKASDEFGIATVFISHKLREITTAADRVVVLKDGAVTADCPARALDREDFVRLMDGGGDRRNGHVRQKAERKAVNAPAAVTVRWKDVVVAIQARPGEIIGFGGLDGHGQREMLHRIYARKARPGEAIAAPADLGFVSGDRAREGNFAFWSIAKNLSVRSLAQVARFKLISRRSEAALVDSWLTRLSVRLGNKRSFMSSLSGGNQQKILIARALSSNAQVILLDDPTRGVDQKTKEEFYQILQKEAAGDRSFIWYATEFEELSLCDRVYVFYENRITDEIGWAELSEARVLRSSFAEHEVGR